ncbi:MAG: VCBS repeat-containing protein, partial [Fidelibacterota bacterium]
GNGPLFVTAADLDGDGDSDLAVANYYSANVSVLLNGGLGTFADAVNYSVGNNPHSVAAADLDGDGASDLAVANSDSVNVSVLLNLNGTAEIAHFLELIPDAFALHQSYPNPFNPVSTIRYDLPQGSDVSLIVYDILGREMARLVDGYLEPGYHQSQWNGRNSQGRELPSGIYIARLCCASPDRPGLVTPPTAGQKAPEYSKSIKMVLLK